MARLSGTPDVKPGHRRSRRTPPCSPSTPSWCGPTRVEVDEGFDRAWRRVGLALDRVGFTVEDRDRIQGIYFVRYVDPDPVGTTGFLKKLFTLAPPPTRKKKPSAIVFR